MLGLLKLAKAARPVTVGCQTNIHNTANVIEIYRDLSQGERLRLTGESVWCKNTQTDPVQFMDDLRKNAKENSAQTNIVKTESKHMQTVHVFLQMINGPETLRRDKECQVDLIVQPEPVIVY